jgi:hypothetical protein
MLKDIFEDKIITAIIGLPIILIALLIIDLCVTTKEYQKGLVIDKNYQAETNGTGLGTGITSNGKPTAMIVSLFQKEKYLLKVKADKIFTAKCTAEQYYSKNNGNIAYIEIKRGILSNHIWKVSVKE